MKIFAFSDYRVQRRELINDAIERTKPDLILYAGDDLERVAHLRNEMLIIIEGKELLLEFPSMKVLFNPCSLSIERKSLSRLRIVFEKLRDDFKSVCSVPFFSVRGNDDNRLLSFGGREFVKWNSSSFLCDDSYYSIVFRNRKLALKHHKGELLLPSYLDKNGIYLPVNSKDGHFEFQKSKQTIKLFGFDCSIGLHSDITNTPNAYSDIFISHIPPRGALDLSTRFGLEHIGSSKLRKLVVRHEPRFVLCGHSHFWGGRKAKIGRTTVLNLSNGDGERDISTANFALIDTMNWKHSIHTVEDKPLKRIAGFGTLMRRFAEFSPLVNEYQTNEEVIEVAKDYGINSKEYEERIQSLNWKRPKGIKPLNLPSIKRCGFVDVETGLAHGIHPGKLWLIGIWFNDEFLQFIVPRQKKMFLRFLTKKQIKFLVHWTEYDKRVLQPIVKKSKTPVNFVDACRRVKTSIIWHSYSLDKLHSALLEHEEKETLIPGRIAGIWADHILLNKKRRCSFCPTKSEVKTLIMQRNQSDVLKLVDIYKFLTTDPLPLELLTIPSN